MRDVVTHLSARSGLLAIYALEQGSQLELKRLVLSALVELAHEMSAMSEGVVAELERCHAEVLSVRHVMTLDLTYHAPRVILERYSGRVEHPEIRVTNALDPAARSQRPRRRHVT